MQAALRQAPVGLLLLDKHFLKKECPFAELRIIMELDRALPVLYETTHDELVPLLDHLISTAASQSDRSDLLQPDDAEKLETLKRITMLQTFDLVSRYPCGCPRPLFDHVRLTRCSYCRTECMR